MSVNGQPEPLHAEAIDRATKLVPVLASRARAAEALRRLPWHAAGLRAGSNDVQVQDVFVPEHRALAVDLMKGCAAPGAAVNTGPLYRLPVLDMFPYVVAATALGIAQGAVEQFTEDTRHRITSYSTTLLA